MLRERPEFTGHSCVVRGRRQKYLRQQAIKTKTVPQDNFLTCWQEKSHGFWNKGFGCHSSPSIAAAFFYSPVEKLITFLSRTTIRLSNDRAFLFAEHLLCLRWMYWLPKKNYKLFLLQKNTILPSIFCLTSSANILVNLN